MRIRLIMMVYAALVGCVHPRSDLAFTIPEADLVPYGIGYDGVSHSFYLGSTYKRKIVHVAPDGSVQTFNRAIDDAPWSVTAIAVDIERRHLWAATTRAGAELPMLTIDSEEADTAAVYKYELDTGALMARYVLDPEPEGHVFHDLVISSGGDVFITDRRARALYTIWSPDSPLRKSLSFDASPTGLAISDDQRYLFVALEGQVARITVTTGELTWVEQPKGMRIHAEDLLFYDTALITVEPDHPRGPIHRYDLSQDYDRITSHTVLETRRREHAQPSAGVIVDNTLHYVANSQLRTLRQQLDNAVEDPAAQLQDIMIRRVQID